MAITRSNSFRNRERVLLRRPKGYEGKLKSMKPIMRLLGVRTRPQLGGASEKVSYKGLADLETHNSRWSLSDHSKDTEQRTYLHT